MHRIYMIIHVNAWNVNMGTKKSTEFQKNFQKKICKQQTKYCEVPLDISVLELQ